MSGGFIVIHRRVSGQQAVLLIDGFHAMSIELKPLAQATVSSASYQHAIDSGVYLRGVDSSRVGARLPVTRDEIGNPSVLLIMGQSNGGNHGEARHVARQAVFNFNPFDGLCYRACDPLLGATDVPGSESTLRCGRHLSAARDTGRTRQFRSRAHPMMPRQVTLATDFRLRGTVEFARPPPANPCNAGAEIL